MDELKKVEAKIFDNKFAWDEIDKEKALEDKRVLDLVREACLIESYFAVYVGKMMDMFWYDIDATSIYTIEAFEAYTHYYVLRRYLDVVGYKPVSDEEIRELREKNKDVDYSDEIEELVNFMATEHFAAHFFQDLSEEAPEPVLKKILSELSKQEVSHSQFAADLLKKRLEENPEIKNQILEYAKDFQHVGAYVLPAVSRVKNDNIKIIQEFNQKIKELTGESLSNYKTRRGDPS